MKKEAKTSQLIGCSWETLKAHIEKQFTKGMNWNNRGDWHIDHIIPLASAKSQKDVEALCHFSNLRPMWAIENIKKGDKPVACQPELLIKLF